MSYLGRKWGFAIESSGAGEVLDAPTAEFNIEVNPDVDETGAPLEAVDAEGNPTIDVVQTEIVEDQAEIEETADQVEKLEDTAEVLEHYAAAIEHRIQTNGGLTAGEYEFLMIGLESRVKNAGNLMPSVESMSRGRLAASREALDSIKEGIRKVWETIKRAIQSLYRKVKGWFVKTFDGAEMLRKRAEGVKKRAEDVNGSPSDTSPLELGGGDGAKLMDKDGKPCFDGSALVGGLQTLSELSDTFIKYYSDDMDKYIDEQSELARKIINVVVNANNNSGSTTSASNNAVDQAFSTQFSKTNSDAKSNFNGGKFKAADKTHVADNELNYRTNADNNLLGGKTLIVVTGLTNNPTTLTTYKKHISSKRMFIKPYYAKHKEFSGGTSKLMTTKEIEKACEHIIDICAVITDYRKKWYNRERLVDRVQKDMDSAVRDAESELSDKEVNGQTSKVTGVIRAISNMITNELNDQVKLISYLLTTCKAALVYCTRSLSRYRSN